MRSDSRDSAVLSYAWGIRFDWRGRKATTGGSPTARRTGDGWGLCLFRDVPDLPMVLGGIFEGASVVLR